ncbi:MAG: hypothetical protein ABSH20_22890 [Tepidisphaeraceae bacterium]|jgi:late competence protein required for DNA uptake (superfamily II DNA/RNA helicase)
MARKLTSQKKPPHSKLDDPVPDSKPATGNPAAETPAAQATGWLFCRRCGAVNDHQGDPRFCSRCGVYFCSSCGEA